MKRFESFKNTSAQLLGTDADSIRAWIDFFSFRMDDRNVYFQNSTPNRTWKSDYKYSTLDLIEINEQ